MPEEHPDGAGAPEPGHFMPGGAGDAMPDGGRAGLRPLTLTRQMPGSLGKARELHGTVNPAARRKAQPLPTDPDEAGGYGAPPPAPLAGAPLTPLTGTRRPGGSRPVGWHSPASRSGAQFSADAPLVKPPRQHSKAIITTLSVLVVIMLTGATIGGFKLIDSYDNPVANPLARPSVKNTEPPLPVPPDPTVTVTAPVVPDLVRLQQNEIYKAGKVASVSCKEPAIKPNSQSAILKYYKALLPCLNQAWAPVIKKAGYEFRAPKVVLQSGTIVASSCSGEENVAYYCPYDETINISWKNDLKNYRDDALGARVWMLDTMAHEYGHHVQNMTEMLTAAWSREGWAKTKAEELEWSRRTELQAGCLGAAFLGANKKPLGLKGTKLEVWEYETQHSGDEYNPKKIRDHGSRKNHWVWGQPAFKSASPASCNTFTAPAAKVS
ncbi:hypothetical protein E0H73_08845 [Kribbella pittospori]|uniref:Metalloprotease n=1 Tax=Kribbella pittospori TaxID=722689 RepID=A0A4R0KU54_9ACTN|nr:neutral zinc metallopeptidase [Kribbella pittospori]TCC64491.1 hypothetical protein E0H73_08845 [Kribbella pittospori]